MVKCMPIYPMNKYFSDIISDNNAAAAADDDDNYFC